MSNSQISFSPQLLALRWIKENIEGFGGDPDNITLAGQSAGAVSANFMMLSDLTEGLFHKGRLTYDNILGSLGPIVSNFTQPPVP